MRRNQKIAVGEFYHLYNRGNRGEFIFFEEADRIRFLFLILYLQLPLFPSNSDYHEKLYRKHGVFYLQTNRRSIQAALCKRGVALVAFALMPNHFHLIVQVKRGDGISKYMQRVQNAYTRYLNTKQHKKGHLFESAYRCLQVRNKEELLYLSALIHRNPKELREWRGKEDQYPFSSRADYVRGNRWGELLSPEAVLDQLDSQNAYKAFVETHVQKRSGKLGEEHMMED